MTINTERCSRNNRRNQYLLRLLTVCGLCGCHISGTSSNRYTYYRCDAKRYGSKKAIPHDEKVSVRHPKLDELVWTALVDLMDAPDRLEEQVARRLSLPTQPVPSPNLEANDKALAQVDAEEERILDAYRQKAIDLAQLKPQLEKVSSRRAHLMSLREALTRPEEPTRQPEITRAILGDLSARYRRAMTAADFPTRRKIVEALVTEVTLYPGKAVVRGVIPIDSSGLRPEFAEPPGS
jgi:hypothetical protein